MDNTQLEQREIYWSQKFNVLYIEGPVGVGFSYSDNATDYRTNTDDTTALANLLAIENFFALFPENMPSLFESY